MTAFLHVVRYSDEKNVNKNWDFGTSWNWCESKIMMLSPSVKTAYLEIF